MHMHGSHGHPSLDGGTQEAARKTGSFPSVALKLAAVCIMTIKSRCKCRRSSRKPDSCRVGYHVNQEDCSFISTPLCGNIGGSFSSKHGSSALLWLGRVVLDGSFPALLRLAVFSVFTV